MAEDKWGRPEHDCCEPEMLSIKGVWTPSHAESCPRSSLVSDEVPSGEGSHDIRH